MKRGKVIQASLYQELQKEHREVKRALKECFVQMSWALDTGRVLEGGDFEPAAKTARELSKSHRAKYPEGT